MKSIGIDIGSSSIKIVELSQSNKGLQVLHHEEHLLPQGPGADRDLATIEFLRGYSAKHPADQVRYSVALRQDYVSTRNKIFPFNDRQKILKSLPFELEEDLPFSIENAVYDAKIVQFIGNTSEVLAMAAPKHRVAEIVGKIKDCGIDAAVLSTESSALANAFEIWDSSIPAAAAIAPSLEGQTSPVRNIEILLQIGHSRSLVLAIESGKLIAVRTLLWGTKSVADALVKKYEIPFVEALKEFKTKAFILPNKEGASYDQIIFSDTIAQSYRDLANELKMSLLEIRSEFNARFERIHMIGGGSKTINLNAFLTMQLDAPVNTYNPFPKLNLSDSQKYAVAAGLAIEGLKRPRNPATQFLKGEFAKQSDALKKFWNDWGLTTQISLAALVVFFIYANLRESTSLSLVDTTSELLKTQAIGVAKLDKKQANEAGIKKFIREQKQKIKDMEQLSKVVKMNSALDIIKKISDAAPPRQNITMQVTSLKIVEQTAEIRGYVTSSKELNDLMNGLKQVAADGKIQSQVPNQVTTASKVPFAFSFKIDRNIDGNMGTP